MMSYNGFLAIFLIASCVYGQDYPNAKKAKDVGNDLKQKFESKVTELVAKHNKDNSDMDTSKESLDRAEAVVKSSKTTLSQTLDRVTNDLSCMNDMINNTNVLEARYKNLDDVNFQMLTKLSEAQIKFGSLTSMLADLDKLTKTGTPVQVNSKVDDINDTIDKINKQLKLACIEY